MLFLTRLFGVTGSDAERDLTREQADIEEITERSLLMQANSAAKQHRPLGRGTHVKGVCARAQFEVFDVAARPRSRTGSAARKGDLREARRLSRCCAVWKRGSEEKF